MGCPVNTFAKSFDFSEDRVRCGCPDEWLRMAVGILDVVIDFVTSSFTLLNVPLPRARCVMRLNQISI